VDHRGFCCPRIHWLRCYALPAADMIKLRRPWTGEEERRLLEMARIDKPKHVIAAALKRSTSAVKGRLKFLRDKERLKEIRSPEAFYNLQLGRTPDE
jgi:hypothetical protein